MAKKPQKFKDQHDPIFSVFAQQVANGIEQSNVEDDSSTQKLRFEALVKAELAFRETFQGYKISGEMYKKFINLIRIVNNNILSARPYFRESSQTFSEKITPALKTKNHDALKEFQINFHFISFCRNNWIGLWPKKLEILYRQVEKTRTIIVKVNLPICINRAKIFYRKTPKGHLSFTDMIQTATMGLCAAVDKYTGDFKANFVGVIIGRIVGNLIDIYSETNIHFYPGDRRIIYRANSIRGRQGITDIPELTKAVNDSFAADLLEGKTAPKPITASEMSDLMAAASIVSADANEGEEGCGVYNFVPDSNESAEEVVGRKQQLQEVSRLARKLPLINQKVLKLKGIEI